MKEFEYLIKISFKGSQPTPDAQHRRLDELLIDFHADGDTAILNAKGLTGYGYKVLNMTLSNAISQLARNAAEQAGLSEGEIIADAVNKLGENLADTELKGKSRVFGRMKSR